MELTVTATCAQTRTLNSGLSTLWSSNDAISIFSSAGNAFYNNEFQYVGNDQFTGAVPSATDGRVFFAVYPYKSSYSSPEEIELNVALEEQQQGNGSRAHLAGEAYPLYGCSTNNAVPSFTMSQLLTVGSFNITNGDEDPIVVKNIEFTAPGPIAGNFVVDITGEKPVYEPAEPVSNKVTLTVSGGEAIAGGESASFYVGMVPFDLSGNYSIRVTAERSGQVVISEKNISNKHLTLDAGSIVGLNYTFVGQAPETYLGSFLLLNEDMAPYLEEAAQKYTDENWRTLTVVTNYRNGDNGDLADDPSLVAYAYDKPEPVVIPVTGHNGENVDVAVFNDEARTKGEYAFTTNVSNASVEVFNLLPGRRYYYTVCGSGVEICRGYFDTQGGRRIIKLSDVVSADRGNNFRDLGGLKTTDGKTLRYNKIFRGTNIDCTTAQEQAYLTGYLNIGLDVDLRRTVDEGRNKAKRILDNSKVDYSNEEFISYLDLINPVKIKPTIQAILSALRNNKAVYIHCFAGADRTGCICMILEAVCGVSEKDCSIDYELTSFSCVSTRARTVYNSGFMGYFHPYILDHYSGSTFNEKFENFLLSCGISAQEIAELRSIMVE